MTLDEVGRHEIISEDDTTRKGVSHHPLTSITAKSAEKKERKGKMKWGCAKTENEHEMRWRSDRLQYEVDVAGMMDDMR